MAIRQRGAGWQADVQHKGQRARETFTTEEDARAWETQAREALRLGRPLPSKVTTARAGSTIQHVLDIACKMRWAGGRDEGSPLNASTFVKWVGANVEAAEALSVDSVTRFISKHLMDERKVSNATINRYLSAISVLADFANIEPKPSYRKLWHKEGQGRIRFFSDEEEALLLQTWALWGHTLERDFLVFLLDTGARPFKEGATLPWRDVGQRKVTFWDTKTKRPRSVPLSTRAWDAIGRQRGNGLEGPWSAIDKAQTTRLYNRTRTHLPQLEDTVLYTARHTCCSRLIQRGADLRRVMEWMGHTGITTTMRYSHLAPQHLMELASLLEPKLTVVPAA